MVANEPVTDLDTRFSSEGARAHSWSDACQQLEEAELYWLATVRPEGRPHLTPLLSVLVDGASYFCTGPTERKARNLATNPHCILMTGCNSLGEGRDVVVEGEAHRVHDAARLQRVADAYEAKYGTDWKFDVVEGGFVHARESLRGAEPVLAYVFEVAPAKAFGFEKGATYGQTRWAFDGT